MYSSYSLIIERFRLVSPFPASPAAYLLSELAQDAFLQPLLCINLSSKSIQVLCQSSNLQSGRGRREANTKTNQHCVNHSDVSVASAVPHNTPPLAQHQPAQQQWQDPFHATLGLHAWPPRVTLAAGTGPTAVHAERSKAVSDTQQTCSHSSFWEYLRGCLFINTT